MKGKSPDPSQLSLLPQRLGDLVNPRHAHHVVIYERQDKTVVSIIKPKVAMEMIGNVELEQIA